MEKSNLQKLTENLPNAIKPTFIMDHPNQKLGIHSGNYKLSNEANELELKGKVWFEWHPILGTKYTGDVIDSKQKEKEIKNDMYDLLINDLVFGKVKVTSMLIPIINSISDIIQGKVIKGDHTIPVSSVRFSIPNLRDFQGIPIKSTNTEGTRYRERGRVLLECDKYQITIDKIANHNKALESLKSQGGYMILYGGEFKKKKGQFSIKEIDSLHLCLANYLTFLNGRRCSPIIIKGIHDEKEIWTDYTNYLNDSYKYVWNWPTKFSIEGFDGLWKEFSKLWNNDNDRDFLKSVIHWYGEANSNAGFIEGSIIMIQVALELIYNWYVIENKKLIVGRDSENLSASNKIRLLLSETNSRDPFPTALENLKGFLDSNQTIEDEIEAFVQIRNAIVHSQEHKRKDLSEISSEVMFEAKELGLWFIEKSMLYILRFNGKYFNRCSGAKWGGEGEEEAPYAKQLND